MQKKLLTLLAIGTSVTLLAGCTSNNVAPTDQTVTPPVTEQVTAPVVPEVPVAANNTLPQAAEEYSVKTEKGNNIPGENINVYDKNGNQIFSLLASNAPDLQRFDKIVGTNLIVDFGTSFDRTLAIYDVTTQQKIFESAYHDDGSGLGINNDSVTFNYTIGETQNLPKCSSDYNGHTEVRIFNLNTKELTKTGEIKCAFFE